MREIHANNVPFRGISPICLRGPVTSFLLSQPVCYWGMVLQRQSMCRRSFHLGHLPFLLGRGCDPGEPLPVELGGTLTLMV